MLDMEKMRADMRHQDRMFALELRRITIGYMAAGAGLLAGAAGLIGALLVIFNAIFK